MLYCFYDLYWKRKNLPPGPMPLLVAGNIPYLLLYNSVDEMFLDWKNRYGPLVTFWIGPIPLVMVTEINKMKEYFVQHSNVFSNRWRNFITDTFMGGANGVVQIDGQKWQEQRRFSLHVLRDFGVGRSLIEPKIELEVEEFIDHLRRNCNKPVDICQMLAVCVGNIIHNILFGYRFPQVYIYLFKGSEEFHRLHSVLDKQSKIVINPFMGMYIAAPWLTKVPFVNKKFKELLDLRETLWTYLKKQVKAHQNSYSSDMELTDFTYRYLKEMEDRASKRIQGYFNEWQLTMLLLDLFFAGMETTVTTMKWGFLMTMIHQDVQAKVQEELDQFSNQIQLIDQARCPYTVATIKEIQRIANILPINLLRTVSEDISLDGYFYSKGTLCIPQISIAMNDPENFDDPRSFRPERFLDDDMKTAKRYDAFMPFSIGKRQCLGESLAKAELFLIYANILRNFKLCPYSNNPEIQRTLGLTVSPTPYKCLVKLRS
uniref:Unspecific monooxygenase n=1 Tax=Syphacia muris TaxID=451379 RepID=A0A158R672_9BILA